MVGAADPFDLKARSCGRCRIGVISDTHGLLRPEALDALRGSDLILHAGDIGRAEILDALERVAPVRAVRGNVDRQEWARALPTRQRVSLGVFTLLLLHDVSELARDPTVEGIDAVISGHSHRPSIERHGAVLYLNPGSAGPRRFSLPLTVARVDVRGERLEAAIIPLPPAAEISP